MNHRRTLLLTGLCLCAFATHAEQHAGRQAGQPALSTLTAKSGVPRAPEQEAVVFEHVDLQFKVDPSRKHLSGDAALTFKATRPITRLVVDLDRNFAVES